MDLALPPMPFSAVFVPEQGQVAPLIPVEMRNDGPGGRDRRITLPPGVVQVIVSWRGVDPLYLRHFIPSSSLAYETVATIPAASSPEDRSTGVLTFSSEENHQIQVLRSGGGQWDQGTIDNSYVVGVQVMPMGTATDITGGGSLLRVDDSVGTRVFLGDQMLHGDTGWRDITALASSADGGTIRVRRRFDEVTLVFDGVKAPAAKWSAFQSGFPLPQGFKLHVSRPYANITYGAVANSWPNTSPSVLVATTAGYNTVTLTADDGGAPITGRYVGLTLRYVTSDSWPTTLPGTAV